MGSRSAPLTVHLGDEIRLRRSSGRLLSSRVLNVCRLSRFHQHLVDVCRRCLTHSGPAPPPSRTANAVISLSLTSPPPPPPPPFVLLFNLLDLQCCFLLMVIALRHKGDDYPALGVLAVLYVTHPLAITRTNRIIQSVVGKSTYRDGGRRRFGREKKD